MLWCGPQTHHWNKEDLVSFPFFFVVLLCFLSINHSSFYRFPVIGAGSVWCRVFAVLHFLVISELFGALALIFGVVVLSAFEEMSSEE